MTDDNKHEDQARKKVSDQELEDVAGGKKIEGQIGKAANQGDGMFPGKKSQKKGRDKDSKGQGSSAFYVVNETE